MNSLKNKRILITCGPTWIPIDAVRVISNVSSGAFGYAIAEEFINEKAKVTILQGQVSVCPQPKAERVITYKFFDELAESLRKELRKKVDVVIHAAAVSDYQLRKSFKGKMSSSKNLKLDLVATPKIINSIKRINPNVFLVGFKLETNLSEEGAVKETKDLFKNSKCDLVVANSIDKSYRGFLVRKNQVLNKASSRKQMAAILVKTVKRLL